MHGVIWCIWPFVVKSEAHSLMLRQLRLNQGESMTVSKLSETRYGCDDSWPAMLPGVVVFSFSLSEAVHTTMHTTKQVECLDW